MADVTVSEYVGISESPTVFIPYWKREIASVLDKVSAEILLRNEKVPIIPIIPRMPTMSFNPSEQEEM